MRGSQNKRTSGWRIVFGISIAVLAIALVALGLILWSYYNGQKQYDELKQYTNVESKTLADMTIDWDGLRAINSDIVGWIYIPDTVISYPIVWKEKDNNYYLYHNFNNKSSSFGAEYGCIFLSGDNKSDWSDNSNFVFGHNMYNATIFSLFSDNQSNSEWFNAHREIYILTPQGNYRCYTYAQNKVNEYASNIAYSSFGSHTELADYVEARRHENLVTPDPKGEESTAITKLFSFSTCSSPDSSNRVITFAYQAEFAGSNSSSSGIASVTDQDVSNVTNDSSARIE